MRRHYFFRGGVLQLLLLSLHLLCINHPAKSFLAGFIGLSLLWGVHAAILDTANDHILSQRCCLYPAVKWFFNVVNMDNCNYRWINFRLCCINGKFRKRSCSLKFIVMSHTAVLMASPLFILSLTKGRTLQRFEHLLNKKINV